MPSAGAAAAAGAAAGAGAAGAACAEAWTDETSRAAAPQAETNLCFTMNSPTLDSSKGVIGGKVAGLSQPGVDAGRLPKLHWSGLILEPIRAPKEAVMTTKFAMFALICVTSVASFFVGHI